MQIYNSVSNDVELKELLIQDSEWYLEELKKSLPDKNDIQIELTRAHRELRQIKATRNLNDA